MALPPFLPHLFSPPVKEQKAKVPCSLTQRASYRVLQWPPREDVLDPLPHLLVRFTIPCLCQEPLHVRRPLFPFPFGQRFQCHVPVPNNGRLQSRFKQADPVTRESTQFPQDEVEATVNLIARSQAWPLFASKLARWHACAAARGRRALARP